MHLARTHRQIDATQDLLAGYVRMQVFDFKKSHLMFPSTHAAFQADSQQLLLRPPHSLWAEEPLPLAAAAQMVRGKVLHRDVWFDKPPLLAAAYLACGARDGFPLRLAGALYVLLACWIAWRFARDLWGRREALWAAGLLAFYLVFDIPSAVTPLAADLLMLAPHLAAVWLAWRGRAFWSGALAGIAFLVNSKGVFVLAACALWNLRALPLLLAGFAIPNALAAALLWQQGALGAYFEQVWKWGRIYAAGTFVANPWTNGLLRTAHWL